jgi:GNAT superfamily N-acetyltransferase
MIKIAPCTDSGYLKFLKDEANIEMNPYLEPVDGLPMAFLYTENDIILGVATLVDAQMHIQIDPDNILGDNPWLIGLWVKETHRNQGIGFILVNATLEYAKDKYTDIYFNTETAQNFYNKHWQVDYIKTVGVTDSSDIDKKIINSDYFTMNIVKNLAQPKNRLKI